MPPFFKLTRTLHAWGGITLVLVLMLLSATGTPLVWKTDYLRLTEPAARVAFTPTPQNLAVIGAAIDHHFAPEEVLGIRFATEELPLTQVILDGERYAYLDTQGGIVDQWQGNERFEEWLYDLHHRLLLGNLGLTLVGSAGCALLILVLAGVLSYWPMRRGWRLGLWPRDTSRPVLLATHRNLGLVLALPLLLTLITGITLAFPTPIENWLLGEMRVSEAYSNAMVEGVDSIEGEEHGEWLPAFERAAAVFPGATPRAAQVPGPFSPYRIIGMQQSGEWSRLGLSRVYIDVTGGWMDIRVDALKLPLRERLYDAAQPLHTGRIGQEPLWYKLLLTLNGLGIFVLSTLGLAAFVRRYVKRR